MSNDVEIQDDLGEVLGEGIPDGAHLCLTKANYAESKTKQSKKVPFIDGEPHYAAWLTITYVIADDTSDHVGSEEVREMFEMFPGLSKDAFSNLTPEEKKYIRMQTTNRIKRFRQLGVPEAKMNKFSASDLADILVEVTVRNNPDKNNPAIKYPNVQSVKPMSSVQDDTFDLD